MRKLIVIFVTALSFSVSAQWDGYTTYQLDENLLPQPIQKVEVNVFNEVEVYSFDEYLIPYQTHTIMPEVRYIIDYDLLLREPVIKYNNTHKD